MDCRIDVNLPDHPKFKALRNSLGQDAELATIYLWLYVARCCPDGEIKHMTAIDLAEVSKYRGDAEAWVAKLIELRLLEKGENGRYSIHDWLDHNLYAATAPFRKQRAQKAASARWGKVDKKQRVNAKSNASSICSEQCPIPSPSPNRKENIIKEKFGEFENVRLTLEQFRKLKATFGEMDAVRRIETLSEYMASKGKRYKDHYATILSWHRKEQRDKGL